nr:hypothetical protein [Streptomyces sp. SID12488]
MDEWMGGKRKLAANTRRSYEGFIRRYLKPQLGDIPLEKLRPAQIRTAYDAIVVSAATTPRPTGLATVQRIHAAACSAQRSRPTPTHRCCRRSPARPRKPPPRSFRNHPPCSRTTVAVARR